MEGKIYRVTYNVNDEVAVLHMEDGSINEVKMSPDKWESMIKGDVVSNFNELIDE